MDAKSLANLFASGHPTSVSRCRHKSISLPAAKNILNNKTGIWKVPNMNSYDEIDSIGPQGETHGKKPLVLV